MEIINLTPHELTLWNPSLQSMTSYPSKGVARVAEDKTPGNLNFVTSYKVSYTDVTGLPTPKENTIYVVSIITAQACAAMGRKEDIYYPGDLVRNERGQVVGCESLYQIK